MALSTVSIPICKWTLVASNVNQGRIRVLSENPSKYYYKIVAFGDPAPSGTPLTGTMMPSSTWVFNHREEIDIYMASFDFDGLVEYDDDEPFTDVFVQDATTSPIEYFLTQTLNAVVINANAGAKTKMLELDPGHGVVIGNHIEIYAETPMFGIVLKRFVQLAVVDVNINTITVQPFISFDLEPANVIFSNRVTRAMNVNGSVTPVRFSIGPPNGLKWDLVRTMIVMVCATNPDDALYGNLAQLPNGVFFGFENDLGQEYLVNILANAGYRATAYDVTYTTRSTGGGAFGVSIRKSFAGREHYGVAIRLEGPTNDIFVTYVNDDLTGLVEHAQKIMGHNVD